ncbi:MAG: hypothetical protein AAFR87_15340 [Bacteroidota bacterium]
MIKKIFKWIAIATAVIIAIAVIGIWAMDKKVPAGEEGPAAEALADKMMAAVNCAAWDTIGAVSWNFAGMNQHLWDKDRHFVQVEWGDGMRALVNINERSGKAYKNGEELSGEASSEAVNAAWKLWVNDAYWLNAPCKVKDPGTSRYLVRGEDGSESLLVKYSTGGATPGDQYLWEVDADGMPTAYSMWVSIAPIGGLKVSWDGWQEHSFAKLSGRHEGLLTLVLDQIKTADSPAELAGGSDPFAALEK